MSELRQALMEGRASIPRLGTVDETAGRFPPFVVRDGGGLAVAPVTGYLKELALSDMSALTCRSYAFDLLRSFRVLWVLGVGWEKATGAEAAVLARMLGIHSRRLATRLGRGLDHLRRRSQPTAQS